MNEDKCLIGCFNIGVIFVEAERLFGYHHSLAYSSKSVILDNMLKDFLEEK
jgi:hypothetical protein